jgi:hypothetical protein
MIVGAHDVRRIRVERRDPQGDLFGKVSPALHPHGDQREKSTMTSMATHIVLAAGLAAGIGMVALSGPAFGKDKYECMTDDGYGRMRSCSASYKAENPAWRGSDNCYTDDGYGRKRQCSASYKAKHQK